MNTLTMAEVKSLATKYEANPDAEGPVIDFNKSYGFVGTVNINGGTSWGGWRIYGDFGLNKYKKLGALARDMGLDKPRDPTILTSTTALLNLTEKVTLKWNDVEGKKIEKEVVLGKLTLISKPEIQFNGSYRLDLKIEKESIIEGEDYFEDWQNAFESDNRGVFKDKTGNPVKIKS